MNLKTSHRRSVQNRLLNLLRNSRWWSIDTPQDKAEVAMQIQSTSSHTRSFQITGLRRRGVVSPHATSKANAGWERQSTVTADASWSVISCTSAKTPCTSREVRIETPRLNSWPKMRRPFPLKRVNFQLCSIRSQLLRQ